ncbi:TBC1 domain family member 23 [Plutella xylostella]|uniref:TBC1 domain family member 23 n=1 Tax=Plutella xylostella TaxID=51655 RepID=UPI002032600D|nr:TBC1 domain family member 23 [Plutella xylostella]
MAGDEDDSTWLIELESALLDGCSAQEINLLTKGKKIPESLRPDVWLLCLRCHDAGNQLIMFDEIFDLPNQSELRDQVRKFVKKLGNDEDDKLAVASDLESIMTFYCKSKSVRYSADNGWIEILLPLLSLKLPRADTYNLFEKILKLYVPKGCVKNGVPFHILRLLLQYHDPELCSFLDTKRITPEQYCLPWLQSLFAGTCNLDVVLFMWDLYFQRSDPFFIFFLCLIMIINAREQLLQMQNEDKSAIIQAVTGMPADLEANDVSDFCSLANYYSLKTPVSFRDDVLELLFSDCELEINSKLYSQALCLPVAVHELVESATVDAALDVESIKFFLVDCRPAEQYNAGHLSTAFHLDCNLMLQEPNAFNTAVQGLLNAQRQALAAGSLAAGEHLCFVGSGRTEEDSYAHMVVASFLKKNTKHVSMLDGGFVAIHDYFGAHMTDCLEEHNPQACLVCAPSNNNNSPMNMQERSRENIPSVQLFSKLSSAMKAKSQEVKGKLIDYIVNPTATPGNGEWHVSANDKKDRRYRNVPPVFSINDEEDESKLELRRDVTDSNSNEEIVDINKFLKELNVVNSFQCQEVLLNGYMLDSFLVVTETHLVILREIPNKQGVAKVMARRPLSTIVKITAKKRHPELITFKYGVPDGDNLLIKDMNRFLIPNAAAATKLVSNQIVQQLDNKS